MFLSRDKKSVKLGSYANMTYVAHQKKVVSGYYTSPEGTNCDLYALGMFLLELITLEKPETK